MLYVLGSAKCTAIDLFAKAYIGEIPCGATVLICMPSPYNEPVLKPGMYGALITMLLLSITESTLYAPPNVFVNTLTTSPTLSP